MQRILPLALLCGLAHGDDAWLTDFKEAAAASKKSGNPVLAYFAGSDSFCERLDAEVFATDTLRTWAKENVVLLRLDASAAQNDELKTKYEIKGTPTILFLDHEGKVLGRTGYVPGGPGPWIEKASSQMGREDPWLTDLKEAMDLAEKTKKPILADFTGSDWCGWCIKLKEEVFSTPEFRKWAKENVILLELDYPLAKPQSDELRKQNEELKTKYEIAGYPTILFLDAKGNVLARSGYKRGGPVAWTEDAEKLLGK